MTKHITLRLAPDHPIFNYPKGIRAKQLREWIESGMNMEEHIRLINDKLKSLSGQPPITPIVVKQDSPDVIKSEEEAIADNDRILQNVLADFLDL